jgi:hypothetical protein
MIDKLETELSQLHSELDQQERGRQMLKSFNRRHYLEAKQSLKQTIEALPNRCEAVLAGEHCGLAPVGAYQ